jgi:signal transduction histidine kinase/ligand-binding sensor domain-containing protein/DNA-binding response OmpR family regulator
LIFLQIFFALLISVPGFGQKIRFYNSERGLPNSLIHKVSQDSLGYIWLATENGASYFDGMNFTTFYHDQNKPGTLASDLVKVIYSDSKGCNWVGTSNGLQIFDREKNSFHDFPLQCADFNLAPYITSIVETLDKKYILVSVSGYGIMVYDIDSHKIDTALTESLKKLYNNRYIGNLYVDSEGFIWSFAEQGSFFKLNFQSKQLETIHWNSDLTEVSKVAGVSAMSEDPVNRNILIGTYNHGVLIYDRIRKEIRRPKGQSMSKFRIRSLLAERKTSFNSNPSIWIGTEDSGLKKFDRLKEDFVIPDFQYAPIDLDNCKVHSIIQDKQGNIWVGIFQKGLLIIPQLRNNFDYIKISESKGSTSVNMACVTSIIRDDSRNLWIGTDGSGLFKISDDGTKTRFTTENTPLSNNSILTLTVDKRGTLWISTYMGGITTYHPQKGFRSYSNDIELQKVNCTAYDKDADKIYFGTLGHGVRQLSLSNNQIESFPSSQESGWINSLTIDKNGILWVGQTGGLHCFDTSDGKEVNADFSEKMKGVTISSSHEGNDGNLWLGSPQGLFHTQKESREIEVYSQNEGLPSNSICAIQEGANGQVWISTMNGLSNFDAETKTFKNYYVHDGLQDNEFRVKATFRDFDGKLFFGGINGISSFYPNRIGESEKLESKLYFSSLSVLNQPVKYDEALGKKNILDRHISQASKITLKRSQNVFSLDFAVLEYANPQKVVYGYMLEGFDKTWLYTDARFRSATYTNLPSGNYTFRVKAFFDGTHDEQNEVYNSINIRILPPWYKTWWAYLLYLSIFMITVWEILNIQIRRKIYQKEKAEYEKKELKLQMFTDLTHEIRTPFTLVMTPLKSLLQSENDPKKLDMFNLMYRNVLRILRLLNQLMDIRKIDNLQFKLHFQQSNLIDFIEDLMKSFEQQVILRNIDFRLVSNLESLEVWIDLINFDKVLFNILSNAFKFTPENGNIMISIDTVKKQLNTGNLGNITEHVEICIENSGSEINENEKERIFDRFYQSDQNKTLGGSGVGLHLAKSIVKLHHGNIQAKNTEKGVAFIIHIPLGNKHLTNEELEPGKTSESIADIRVEEKENTEKELNSLNDPLDAAPKTKKLKHSLVFVDDDADLGKYLRMELASKYNIEVFTNAADAWKLISTTIPDAVVTDLLMPDTDGISLCKKIKQNPETNHVPVIILTSETSEECEQQCIDDGVDYYLTKPINLDLLKSTIAHAIQTREMIRNKYQNKLPQELDEIQISSPDSRLVSRVIETIRKNIENPEFNIDDLSREVGLSRAHLNRKLKENINISPNNLIKSIRLKQAAYLLINNKVNISDVAYKVGFSSHSYFSNNFKEYFGMAPTEFVSKYNDPEEKENLSKLFEK